MNIIIFTIFIFFLISSFLIFKSFKSTINVKGISFFKYLFENGDKLEIGGNRKLIFSKKGATSYEYGLNIIYANKFITFSNFIIKNAINRRTYNRDYSSPKKPQNPKSKWSDHPKGELYQNLKNTVENRKRQLNNIKKGSPEWNSMKNELDNAETALNNMRVKYNFESLKSFENFSY